MTGKRPPRQKPSPDALIDLLLWNLKNTPPKDDGRIKAQPISLRTGTPLEYPGETLPGVH